MAREGGDMNNQDMMQPGMDPGMMGIDPGMMGMISPYPRIAYTPQAIACFKLYDKDGYCIKEFSSIIARTLDF